MRSEQEINAISLMPYKEVEKKLGIKIRNGQTMEGIRKALRWALS